MSDLLALNDTSILICFIQHCTHNVGKCCGSDGKESACSAEDLGLIPVSGRFPWGREWLPTPLFLPGESHGQRSLVGYSPWSHLDCLKNSDTY